MVIHKEARSGGVVEGAKPCCVGPGQHEEGGVWACGLGLEEDIGGLAGSDEESVGGERLDVAGVDIDNGKRVAGDAEEELVIECSIDDAKEVGLPWLYLELERVYETNKMHE